MKHTLAILTTLLLAPLVALHAAETNQPNIIIILTDDHGWADLGAQGVDKHIRTPNVDQLARDGVRFSRGYVTAPQCTPSRAGLISGQYQNKFGVEQNFDPMRSEVVTLPERLKTSGYITGSSGKWHLDSGGRGKGGDEGKFFDRNLAPLFDITKPDGEHHTRELSNQHPEIAKRLRAKLDTWMSTLTRPGPPGRLVRLGHFTGAEILPSTQNK